MGNCAVCVGPRDSFAGLLAENKATEYLIFSKSNDPDCIKARTLLFTNNKLPNIVEITRSQDSIKNHLVKVTKQSKPPYIFHKGEFLGGLNELEKHLKKANTE